tara:strand:+ start:747 stop:1100 length:354 start_codon:yes stop_codon:yes gene_type:complete
MGIQILEIQQGYAQLKMKVAEWMVQGHEVCHGGFLFTLADTAMAYASNSYGPAHVALSASLDFLRPANKGDILIAEAIEKNRTRSTGFYCVSVSNQEKKLVGEFRGRTYALSSKVTN